MEKELRELLRLIHEEASRAYWDNHKHCGGDWSELCRPYGEPPGCPAYVQCRDTERIAELLRKV